MKKQLKCYIYTRVSTTMQVDGYSLDAQRDKLRRYAEFQEMEIAGEYCDQGYSGKKPNNYFLNLLICVVHTVISISNNIQIGLAVG